MGTIFILGLAGFVCVFMLVVLYLRRNRTHDKRASDEKPGINKNESGYYE